MYCTDTHIEAGAMTGDLRTDTDIEAGAMRLPAVSGMGGERARRAVSACDGRAAFADRHTLPSGPARACQTNDLLNQCFN